MVEKYESVWVLGVSCCLSDWRSQAEVLGEECVNV